MTGKEKAARVPLNYPETIGRPRVRIAWIVAGASLLVFAGFVLAGRWKQVASPGPIHSAHAAWEDNCAACHAAFEPSSSRNGLHGLLGTGKASDALCKNCHQGPVHHANEKAEDFVSCAGCHVDHQGRFSRLASVPDQTCTACHRNLKNHVKEGTTGYHNAITSFVRDHPQFNVGEGESRKPLGEARDPGRLKFNHALHLTPGQKYAPDDAGGWTLGQIPEKSRAWYAAAPKQKNKGNGDLVVLDCASCHSLDATDGPNVARAWLRAPGQNLNFRSPGAYFQPVVYQQHCAACHQLTFDPSADLKDVAVPHHLQPTEVREFIRGVYAYRDTKEGATPSKQDGAPLPGPNKSRDELKKTLDKNTAKELAFVFGPVLPKVERFLYSGKSTCGLCHEYEQSPGALLPTKIQATNVPQIWFPHAKFSHKSHRALDCLGCHGGAEGSTSSKDVLLPGVASCQKCHAPPKGSGADQVAGVRHDCVTCHQYHHGDQPKAGRGAAARTVEKRLDLDAFLRGALRK